MDFLNLGWFRIIREGNGKPLQCSCLENPRDRGAWWAAVSGVAQSQTRPKRLSSSRIIYSSLLCLLENDFGIKPGIIFAEMPCGRQHLQNLDDAINRSAWTILLLTENFLRDTWCKFQFYSSLMNSVNRQHKYNSVIPMRPLNNPLPRERTPFALRTINALEEESRGFPTQVERIFQESVYRIQQAIWKETRNMVQRQSVAWDSTHNTRQTLVL